MIVSLTHSDLSTLPLDMEGRASIDSDLRLLGSVEAEIAQQDQQLAQAAYDEPRVKLLMTLPGPKVCAILLAVRRAF